VIHQPHAFRFRQGPAPSDPAAGGADRSASSALINYGAATRTQPRRLGGSARLAASFIADGIGLVIADRAMRRLLERVR